MPFLSRKSKPLHRTLGARLSLHKSALLKKPLFTVKPTPMPRPSPSPSSRENTTPAPKEETIAPKPLSLPVPKVMPKKRPIARSVGKKKARVLPSFRGSSCGVVKGSTLAASVHAFKARVEESVEKPPVSVQGMQRCYSVVFGRAVKGRKHNKMSNDGVLVVDEQRAFLKDMTGKDINKKSVRLEKVTALGLGAGSELFIGGKILEIMHKVDFVKYLDGSIFSASVTTSVAEPGVAGAKLSSGVKKAFIPSKSKRPASAITEPLKPLHDPDAEDALVLCRPRGRGYLKADVAVVVDPHLTRCLRPHQREGVQFLWECVNNRREYAGQGCLLGDAMGLGKTLQAIALIWTMLKQSPQGKQGVVKRVFVVCPTTLVKNWLREFKRWLGDERLRIQSLASCTNRRAKEKIDNFRRTNVHRVFVLSYEAVRQHAKELSKISCGLVICDEGHRLKSTSTGVSKAVSSLMTKRRVILTGTMVQNNLDELYALIHFVNPGVFGDLKGFKNVYADPITKSREPGCSEESKALGVARAKQLSTTLNQFFLRRTAAILEKYLLAKTDISVFCRLSPVQVKLYEQLLKSGGMRRFLSGRVVFTDALRYISLLRKLCNGPSLIWRVLHPEKYKIEDGQEAAALLCDLLSGSGEGLSKTIDPYTLFPAGYQEECEHSGKITVLRDLLRYVKWTSNDRVVVCSNFTKTMDVLGKMFDEEGFMFVRMDGSTSTKARQERIDRFNNKYSDVFIFLLSTRTGGLGLNLIGGNRLVLFDPDWNPAVDQQAMARIHREGQTKQVFIYRFFATGTLEEKIYQRQVKKLALGGSVVESKNVGKDFSAEDVRDLFSLHPDTLSDTHELMDCECCDQLVASKRRKVLVRKRGGSKAVVDTLVGYKHIAQLDELEEDPALRSAAGDIVSMVFVKRTEPEKQKEEEEEDELFASLCTPSQEESRVRSTVIEDSEDEEGMEERHDVDDEDELSLDEE